MTHKAKFLEVLIGGIRKRIAEPVNYDKLREVTQGRQENPVMLYSWLEQAFKNIDQLRSGLSERESSYGSAFYQPIHPRH